MSTLYKAMTRPAMYVGVPVVPLTVVAGALFLAGVYISKLIWLAIPVAVFVLRMITKQDDHIFNLYFLKLKMLGNSVCNRFFGARAFLSGQYEAVEIDEFVNAMKLNERITTGKYIPYSSHVDKNIVKTKNGDYVATWQLMGINFESISAEMLETIDSQVATLVRSFSGLPVSFYNHSCRASFYDAFTTKSGNKYADIISDCYYGSMKKNKFKGNTLYFTLIYRPDGRVEKLEKRKKSIKEKKDDINIHVKRMNEMINTFSGALDKFTCKLLGMYEENGKVFSSQLSFYNYLLTGKLQKIRVTDSPVYNVLGGVDVFFNHDTGQICRIDGNKFFRSIEIKDFCSETASGVFDVLQYSDADYVITHSYTSMSKSEALSTIKRAEKQLKSTEDDAVTQLQELEKAKNDIVSGDISFGYYHFTLMVMADSIRELDESVSKITADFTDLGIIPALSTMSLPAAYFAQLPAVFHLRPRLSPVSNVNFVELASFHNFYQGKRDKNCWTEAVAILKTPSKQAYYLNLHNSVLFKDETGEKNLANTKVIGTAGSGKTMFLSYLACSLQKYNNPETFADSAKNKKLTCVFLDKDRGAELCIRMLGGEYYTVKSGEPTGWNPFALEATKRNRIFVKQLMEILCTRNGERLSTRERLLISESVDAVMDFPPGEMREYGITRMLEHLMQRDDRDEQENGIILRLSQWANGQAHGWVFDNAKDTFNIQHVNNFGIDGTEFLDDPMVCAPITFYLLYRITQLLDGRRLVIFLDEFWKWLQDEAFSDFVYNKLKTIRKLNGLVIPATQSPDEILKNKISRAVVEVCSTSIYLANPDADYNDYVEGLKLTPEEFNIVKNLDPMSRQFLIKKSSLKKGDGKSFSALATLDLSGLGGYLKILSASADNLEIFESIYHEGMEPDDWVPEYLERAI
ncbi:VirB4 family type IV secretion/conjugal transfer ATPase [Escherichia coli]|uniref:VirB4 family type IV secretion/conjugal transfer ATPase n=1 Tax=Escherichia coli TaxID=562 RepID=UPI00227EB8BA|nr:VirB4 family type IV secretion/conjugal transfer ATPase [Escherichia coli]